MGLFRKKKSSSSHGDSAAQSDDFGMFEYIDEENYTPSNMVERGYDEFDDFDFGLDSPSEVSAEKEVKEKPRRSIFPFILKTIAAIVAIVFIGGTAYEYTHPGTLEKLSERSADGEKKDGAAAASGTPQNKKVVQQDGLIVNEEVGVAYTSSDLGNPVNGTGAILAFDYHYYVDRSGEKVRGRFNPNIKAYTAQFIQSEINKIPQGTRYELKVTPVNIGREYDVELVLTIPGTQPVTYSQHFFTVEKDGEFYVEKFTSRLQQR